MVGMELRDATHGQASDTHRSPLGSQQARLIEMLPQVVVSQLLIKELR